MVTGQCSVFVYFALNAQWFYVSCLSSKRQPHRLFNHNKRFIKQLKDKLQRRSYYCVSIKELLSVAGADVCYIPKI